MPESRPLGGENFAEGRQGAGVGDSRSPLTTTRGRWRASGLIGSAALARVGTPTGWHTQPTRPTAHLIMLLEPLGWDVTWLSGEVTVDVLSGTGQRGPTSETASL